MSDDQIRKAYQAGLARAVPAERAGCVSPDDLQALIDGVGGETDRLRRLDHVMSCAECHREFALLQSIASADDTSRPAPSRVPMALAASIVLLIAAGAAWQFTRPTTPVFRSGPSETVRTLSPVGSVASADTLRWTSAGTDARYEVEILDGNGAVVFSGTTNDTLLALPDPGQLSRDTDYRWILRVVTLDSGRAVLEPVEFRIR